MNYRMYTFTNIYLSSIQKGIQSAHCITDMIVKYDKPFITFFNRTPTPQTDMLNHWMKNDKTMIVMNGGGDGSLEELHNFFMRGVDCMFPFAKFNEDDYSLNGALTCVGILLPERIYEGAKILRHDLKRTNTIEIPSIKIETHETSIFVFNDFEVELMQRLNRFQLA